jgi:peroxiredoxin
MAQLRQDYPRFVAANTEVIAVGPEDAKSFTAWWHEHEMPFIGIPDPKHEIAQLFGQQSKLLKGGRMPALTVIDMEGKIRFMHYGDSMSDIPSDEAMLTILNTLDKPEPNIPTPAPDLLK